MRKNNIVIYFVITLFCVFGITSSKLMASEFSAVDNVNIAAVSAPDKKAVTTNSKNSAQLAKPVTYTYTPVKALNLVQNPSAYLNKRVKITAKFDKFSSLGLDYKPAMRSSEKFITFLIRRDDAQNDIPLSELKNFMKRETAEKFIDLETDDVVEYSGLVFSNALGDVWLEVENFKIISSKSKTSPAKTK